MLLYNTLTKQEEEFVPLDPAGKRVTFYSCGPTVYDFAHIGNFRSFLNADVLRRTLELLGYEVRHVMNITDVGHMTDDTVADASGEDRMQVASERLREQKKSGRLPSEARDIDPADPFAIANYYADAFLDDARLLGLKVAIEAEREPELMPRPTQYIPQMIAFIEKLIERGCAYVAADGVVYFDVRSFSHYGQLSGNTLESLREGEGGRISATNQAVKRHPADFMLWKRDPRHIMRWPSPWGEGYPGWHLECSVMASALLANKDGMIDLHSGGEDNIFPHHECEIAQSCCASDAPAFATYWFHTRFLIVESAKMSKSKGNFFTVRDLLERGASPAAIRLELIKTHYRSNANFTFRGLSDSQRMVERWARLRAWLETHRNVAMDGPGPLERALPEFIRALESDLNVARAIGVLNEAEGEYALDAPPHESARGSKRLADELAALERMDSMLGVLDLGMEASVAEDEAAIIETKIAERNAARGSKDFKRADAIRDELLAMGIAIKDSPTGTTWSRVVK